MIRATGTQRITRSGYNGLKSRRRRGGIASVRNVPRLTGELSRGPGDAADGGVQQRCVGVGKAPRGDVDERVGDVDAVTTLAAARTASC
jgi:hypothetical protein